MGKPYWFVLREFNYEGIAITKFISEAKAREDYAEAKASQFIDGCALINGDIIDVKNISDLEKK